MMSARRFEWSLWRELVRDAIGRPRGLASIGGELALVERHALGVPGDAHERIAARCVGPARSASGGALPASVAKVEGQIAALHELEVLEPHASEQTVARSSTKETSWYSEEETLDLHAGGHATDSPHFLRDGALQPSEPSALEVDVKARHGLAGL